MNLCKTKGVLGSWKLWFSYIKISARFRPIFDFELGKRSRAEPSWKSFSSSSGSSQLGSDSWLVNKYVHIFDYCSHHNFSVSLKFPGYSARKVRKNKIYVYYVIVGIRNEKKYYIKVMIANRLMTHIDDTRNSARSKATIKIALCTIHILRQQRGRWVGQKSCIFCWFSVLFMLTWIGRWVGPKKAKNMMT